MRTIVTALVAASLFSTAAVAQAPSPPGTVSTRATATERLPNTVAEITVAITLNAADIPALSAAVAQRTKTVLAYLQTRNTERLQTGNLDIQPEMQQVPGKPDRVTGYSGHTEISFRATPEAMPALIAGCLDNGANALGGLRFSPREEEIEAAHRRLATAAAKTALADARAVAEAVGQHVTGVQSIDVGSAQANPMPMMASMMRAAAPMPAVAGDATVAVSVTVQARISD